MTSYRINERLNGVEIIFDAKPSDETRAELKGAGFRWNKTGGYWYAVQSPERLALAEKLAEGVAVSAPSAVSAEKINKFGVKVGDWFSASWGYDQTNNDFFQVVELVGASSVRVRQAHPDVINTEAVSGMSEDMTIHFSNTIAEPTSYSVFIKDQERGDLKRLRSYNQDGSAPSFYLSSFCDAHYVGTDTTRKYYESWYA